MRKNFGKAKRNFDFFLKRTRAFLDLLGSPDQDFKYIHVTGTAGKGSVSTMLEEVLSASGKKVGLHTSPHVTTSTEKIKANGLYISPEEFVGLVEYIKPFVRKAQKQRPYGAPSAFELFFAIALLYFKKQKCEWVVLEVGLGGRYDATNVIQDPKVTVITTIDYDHTEILGKTLNEIAYDKAGIIKTGSVFFTAEQRPSLQALFKKICQEKKVSFNNIDKQGNYQEYNKALVSAICAYLGIPEQSIEEGIAKTRLACRFELIQEHPRVILDGAHNRAKIRSTFFNISNLAFKKLIVVAAIADTNRDHEPVLKAVAEKADHIIFTQVSLDERRTVHPKKLLEESKAWKRRGMKLEAIEDHKEALKRALQLAAKDDIVLVTGSFFLAGELRKQWYPEEWVLRNRKSFK
jgi:dihydrofolate synthase/folylpolyglutamate synthase